MENNNANQAPANNMAVGILSYLGLLWIVAFIIHGNGKTAYGAAHLRQGLGLLVMWVAMWIVFFILGMLLVTTGMASIAGIIGMLGMIVYLALAVFAIIGIINAAQNKTAELPVVGSMFSKWFANVGN
jgi:hypothetical protein